MSEKSLWMQLTYITAYSQTFLDFSVYFIFISKDIIA